MVRVLYKSEQGVALNISDSYRERNRERETTTDQHSKKLIRERRKKSTMVLTGYARKVLTLLQQETLVKTFAW